MNYVIDDAISGNLSMKTVPKMQHIHRQVLVIFNRNLYNLMMMMMSRTLFHQLYCSSLIPLQVTLRNYGVGN